MSQERLILLIFIRQTLVFYFGLAALYAYRYGDTVFFQVYHIFALFLGVVLGQVFGVLRLLCPQCFSQIKKGFLFFLILLLVALALVHPDLPRRFEYRSSLRLQGVFSSPNHFGVLMGVGFLMTIGFLVKIVTLSQFKLGKIGIYFLSLSSLVTGAALLGSYSRGALAATVAGFLYLFIVLEKHKEEFGIPADFRRRFLQGLYEVRHFVVIFCNSLFLIAFWSVRHTELSIIRRTFSVFNWDDFSIRNRGLEYLGQLQILANHIWTGVGWGQTINMYDGYYRDPVLSEVPGDPSNGWLSLGTSTGLFGILVFLGIIRLSFRSMNSDCKIMSAVHFDMILVRAVIVALLVASFFSGNFFFWPVSLILWTFLEFAWQHHPVCVHNRKIGSQNQISEL